MANDYGDFSSDNNNHIVISSENSYKKLSTRNSARGSNGAENITSTMRVDDFIHKITSISKITNSNASTRHLLEITVATLKIAKRNREFQLLLTELQSDTANFLNSVLENPENHSMKEHFKYSVL
jgi:hypothetical protein